MRQVGWMTMRTTTGINPVLGHSLFRQWCKHLRSNLSVLLEVRMWAGAAWDRHPPRPGSQAPSPLSSS